MNNEQLDRIERMLQAQLRGAGHIWWIGGYVYGQTSNGDLFIILYAAAEGLKEKIVRVYDRDMKKLPAFIQTDGIDGGDTEANPSKEQARKKGIYHECPAFEIVTFDGKDTQMGKERRFGDVLRLSKAARDALGGQPQGNRPLQQPAAARPPEPPPALWDDAPGDLPLPDYQAVAVKAGTAAEFDYAAYMVLRNGIYTDEERVSRSRESIIPGWTPSERSNRAMMAALEAYRDERHAADGRGASAGEGHSAAKRVAMDVYNKVIGS